MADKMTPALKKALKAAGFGDLDPKTGPQNNPNYLNEWYAVGEFLRAADAHENPWVEKDYVAAKYADLRLDPSSDLYEGEKS